MNGPTGPLSGGGATSRERTTVCAPGSAWPPGLGPAGPAVGTSGTSGQGPVDTCALCLFLGPKQNQLSKNVQGKGTVGFKLPLSFCLMGRWFFGQISNTELTKRTSNPFHPRLLRCKGHYPYKLPTNAPEVQLLETKTLKTWVHFSVHLLADRSSLNFNSMLGNLCSHLHIIYITLPWPSKSSLTPCFKSALMSSLFNHLSLPFIFIISSTTSPDNIN